MSKVTYLHSRTHAVRRALERYAELHPAQANYIQTREDLPGFITDLLVELHHLAVEEEFSLTELWEKAGYQAIKEFEQS